MQERYVVRSNSTRNHYNSISAFVFVEMLWDIEIFKCNITGISVDNNNRNNSSGRRTEWYEKKTSKQMR